MGEEEVCDREMAGIEWGRRGSSIRHVAMEAKTQPGGGKGIRRRDAG